MNDDHDNAKTDKQMRDGYVARILNNSDLTPDEARAKLDAEERNAMSYAEKMDDLLKSHGAEKVGEKLAEVAQFNSSSDKYAGLNAKEVWHDEATGSEWDDPELSKRLKDAAKEIEERHDD